MLHLEEWMNLKDLHNHGVSVSEIARRTGRDRKTVRKYLQSARPPRPRARKRKPSKLDPFKEYVLAPIRTVLPLSGLVQRPKLAFLSPDVLLLKSLRQLDALYW